MGNQGWIVFVFLGISAISWVFGKMKEKAEAEEAQKRARLHQQRLERIAASGEAPASEAQAPTPTTKQQQILARKQQLAQLRQERLAALRAEMAARQQKQQQQSRPAQARTAAREMPSAKRQPSQRATPPTAPSRTVNRPANKPMPSAAPRQQKPARNLSTPKRTGLAQQPHPQRDVEHRTVHRLVADAETPIAEPRQERGGIFSKYTREDWRKAIIAAEVLGPPVSMRQGS